MTTQLATDIKPVAPLRSKPEVWWMGFTLDHDEDEAQCKFIEKHGHPPRVILRDGAIMKLGPIDANAERGQSSDE